MKHGSLISPDEASFGFGASNAATIETISTTGGGADFITVPDAHLLFSGEFKHSGHDLKIIGDDGKSFLVTDYFKTDKRPTLNSPDGATLSGDIVDLLAGPLAPGQYAQAGAPQPSANEAVGRVAVVTGNVTIIRNGVTVTVNAGDVVLKNDVVQTGTGATCGLALNDGSTFNLTGGARLAINEFVYDPNGTANSSLTTLIQGAATFVAGQIAKTGDMKVASPVATMGIRGTAVILDINAADGRVSISVIDQRDNLTHSVEVYDRAGNLIATATSIGGKLFLTPTATLEVIASFTNKTPDQVAVEFAAFQAVLSSYDAAKQFFPNLPDHTDLNTTPKSTQHAEGTQIQPSDGSGPKTLPDAPRFGDKIVVVEVINKTPADPQGDTTNPNSNNDTDPSDNPDGPSIQNFPTVTYIFGTAGNDDGIASPILIGTPGTDFVFGGPGNDTIEGGDGRGIDSYDGGEGFDKLIYPSATTGLIFNLYGIASENNTADDAPGFVHIDHDTFTNIERIESGSGDDIFILHSDDAWEIDAGSGFDIVKLVAGLNIFGDGGPEISNFEMVDLTNGGGNIVQFEGGGIDEHNPGGVIRIIGDAADAQGKPQDIVKLTAGGANGHWEFVTDGRTSDEDLFDANDHHSDGVIFDTYVFVDDYGCTIATAYIDKDISAAMGAPDALVEQGATGDGIDETTVKLASGAVEYDDTGWSHTSREGVQEYNGHYYQHVLQGVSWAAAQAAALAAGGYLANVTSQGENDFLTNLIDYAHGGYTAYLGATDTANEGTFVWQNGPEAGQAVNDGFYFWAYGEPNNNGGENYLIMVAGPGSNEGGHWNDVSGGARGYLIEYDSNESSVLTKTGTYGYVTLDTVTNELTYHLDDADADTQALAEGQTVTDSFAIVVDENGTLVTRNVEFTIEGSNDAPVTDDGSATGNEDPDQPITISLTGSDAEGSLSAFRITSLPQNGTLFLDAAGTVPVVVGADISTGDTNMALIYFKPDVNWNGQTTFAYAAVDGDGVQDPCDASYIIDVAAKNDAPVAKNDTITNATAPEGDGWVLNEANGHYYKLLTGSTNIADATVAAAAAGGYLATITSASEQSFIVESVLPDFFGPYWDAIWLGGRSNDDNGAGSHWFWTAGPEDGTALTFTNWTPGEPNSGFDASTQYIQIQLASGTWNDATDFGQPGNGIGDATLVEWGGLANQIIFREDTGTTLTVAQLLANDTDVDLNTLSITGVSAASAHGGTVSLNNGIITYNPAADYNGADSFTYTLSDGVATTTGTVSFNVAAVEEGPPNEAPVIHTNRAYTDGDDFSTKLAGLSISDGDATHGELFHVTLHAEHGTLKLVDDGDAVPATDREFDGTKCDINDAMAHGVIYTAPFSPDPENPNDMVTLTVTDGHGGTDTVNFIFNNFTEFNSENPHQGATLIGTAEKDVIFGTGLNDTLTGNDNADTFVFDHNVGYQGIGHDTVNDFTVGIDKIDLGGGFGSVPMSGGNLNFTLWKNSQVNGQAAIQQTGDDTVIHLSGHEDITLKNVLASSLTANDFIIHPGTA